MTDFTAESARLRRWNGCALKCAINISFPATPSTALWKNELVKLLKETEQNH
jgi:hypothetical protein